MGTIIKLNDIAFSNLNLPSIGDYGQLFEDMLLALFKIQSSTNYLEDSLGTRNDLSYVGNASAAYLPTFANGILSVPDAYGIEGTYNRYATNAQLSGINRTFVILFRPQVARGCYLFQGSGGVNMFYNPGGAGSIQAQFGNAAGNKVVTLSGAVSMNVWSLIVFTADANGVSCSVNGASFSTALFSDNGGAPTSSPATTLNLGSTLSQSIQGDFAFAAVYDRTFTENEAISTYKGVKSWVSNNKSISVP